MTISERNVPEFTPTCQQVNECWQPNKPSNLGWYFSTHKSGDFGDGVLLDLPQYCNSYLVDLGWVECDAPRVSGFMVAGRYLVLVRWVKLNQETHIAS